MRPGNYRRCVGTGEIKLLVELKAQTVRRNPTQILKNACYVDCFINVCEITPSLCDCQAKIYKFSPYFCNKPRALRLNSERIAVKLVGVSQSAIGKIFLDRRESESRSVVALRWALIWARLTGGACVPAFVNPEPLVWVGANHALDGSSEISCVDFDVTLLVACADKFDRRVAVKEIAPAFFVPDGACRNDYSVRAQGEHGRAGSRAG